MTADRISYRLADDVEIDARPGDVVTLTIKDRQVTDVTSIGADDRGDGGRR